MSDDQNHLHDWENCPGYEGNWPYEPCKNCGLTGLASPRHYKTRNVAQPPSGGEK